MPVEWIPVESGAIKDSSVFANGAIEISDEKKKVKKWKYLIKSLC